jgi:DNA mismatch repair protein MutL
VRFREQSLVHEVVRRALTDALGRSGAPGLTLSAPASSAGLHFGSAVPAALSGLAPGETMPIPGVLAGGFYPSRWRQESPAGISAPGRTHQAPGTDAVFPPLVPLGQFRDTFIVAVDTDGIAIIDQHVAHERVLYERTLERLATGRLESQRLLVPMIVEMASGTREALLGRAADLDRLGFVVEDFGGSALRVSAAPALLGAEDAASTRRRPGRPRPRESRRSGDQAHGGDHRVPRGGQGELPADLREDGAHPLRAGRDVVLDDLSPRPTGDAASDTPRSRTEFRKDLAVRKCASAEVRKCG